jgi:hypothetical protein
MRGMSILNFNFFLLSSYIYTAVDATHPGQVYLHKINKGQLLSSFLLVFLLCVKPSPA